MLAVVIPVLGLVTQIQTLGVNLSIVLGKASSPRELSTMFWVQLAASACLSLAMAAAAGVVARIAGDPRLVLALTWSAAIPLLYAIGNLPYGLLSRALRLKEIALVQMAAFGLATATAVIGAWATGSYWALIAAQAVSPLITALGYSALARWIPGAPGPFAEVRPHLALGLHVTAANLFTYLSRNADNLIVAAAATPRVLGLYDRSYRALLYPVSQAVQPLSQAVVPALSRTVEPARYRRQYWTAIAVLLLICSPLLVVATINPAALVAALLGSQWGDAAPLFATFAAMGLFYPLQSTLPWLLMSQGRGRELMILNLISAALALGSFATVFVWDVPTMIVVYALGQGLICLPFGLWWTGRSGPVDLRDMIANLVPHLGATGITLALVAGLKAVFGYPGWPLLAATTVAAYLVFAATLCAFPRTRPILVGLMQRGAGTIAGLGQRRTSLSSQD